jgi:hypothetical protein
MRVPATAVVAAIALLAMPALSSAQNAVSEEHNGLLHELQTNAAMYWMHEPVEITYSVTNVSPDSILLGFSCGYHAVFIWIYDPSMTWIWVDPVGCLDVMWGDTLHVGESYSKNPTWHMWNYDIHDFVDEPGVYTIEGELHTWLPDYYYSVSVPIQILDPAAMVGDQLPSTWSAIKALYRRERTARSN